MAEEPHRLSRGTSDRRAKQDIHTASLQDEFEDVGSRSALHKVKEEGVRRLTGALRSCCASLALHLKLVVSHDDFVFGP